MNLFIVKWVQVTKINNWCMKNARLHYAVFALIRRLRLDSMEFKGVFCQRLD